jgi:colicin import membrane protein
MITRFYAPTVQQLLTTFLIALCAYSMPAIAQNASNVTSQKPEETAEQRTERARIASERAGLQRQLDQQRQACYQKLAVTPCLNEARDTHNDKMRDLKRQEVALNDAQRKRAAADRLQAVDERNSPEAQQKLAERRGRALEASERREASRVQRENSRAAKQAAAANMPVPSAPSNSVASSKPAPQGKPRAQPKPAKVPDAAQMERSRQQAAKREKDLAERRAKAQEREANRKKPAAKPLPIPN